MTRNVSEPLANICDRYLPEQAKSAVAVGIDPVEVVVGCWQIIAHCQANEKHLVEQYLAARETAQRPPSGQSVAEIDPLTAAVEAAGFEVISDTGEGGDEAGE